MIALIAEIIVSKISTSDDRLLKIYDCTCGGGNLLFGVEDRIKQKFECCTQTYGQDWNDALYALAKIESRFRTNSQIEYGNSLTEDKFAHHSFDVVVANPPYGVSWKGYQKDIENDQTGRFKYLPAISDGQLLFMQHLISKMDVNGIGVVVHNGSTLFSGDAGSSESNIRKWLLDSNIVEAIIQLPTAEFFNTSIYTYLWVLNKNKDISRENKVILINASEKFKTLPKNQGAKRKEIDQDSRWEIVETLRQFADNDYARVFDQEFFYFNKQAIILTNVDQEGRSFVSRLKEGKTHQKLMPIKIENGDRVLTEFTISRSNLWEFYEQELKPLIDSFDDQDIVIITEQARYWFDRDRETLVKETNRIREELGCGKIVVNAAFKKANKKLPERIEITVKLMPDDQKDYEIIPFHRDQIENQKGIADFMEKYLTKPFKYLDNVVGVEINFNKIFYQPEKLRSVAEILEDLVAIEQKLKQLEQYSG